MFNPFPSFFNSYYFLAQHSNPVYFTYDPWANSPKTASNIILVKGQSEITNNFSEEEKCQESKEDLCKRLQNQRRKKQNFTQRQKRKNKIQKQALTRKQKKVPKHAKKTELVQKQGRNSHSNILRKFFKLLSMETEFFSTVQRIIQKLKLEIEAEQYFTAVRAKNIDHRNYIRIKEVQGLFQYNKSCVNKITRILFQNYLENYYFEHLLSSKKTDNKSIIFHLRGKRTIREDIYDKKSLENESNEERFALKE